MRHTADGRNPVTVEAGSLSHFCAGIYTSQVVIAGFLNHRQSGSVMDKQLIYPSHGIFFVDGRTFCRIVFPSAFVHICILF